MESLADNFKGRIDPGNLELFHEFLSSYTDIFTINIYATKDYTYHNLSGLIQIRTLYLLKVTKILA